MPLTSSTICGIPTWIAFQLGTCNLESVNIKKHLLRWLLFLSSRSLRRRNNRRIRYCAADLLSHVAVRPREEPAGLKLLEMDWVQEDRKIVLSSPMTGQLVAQVPGKWFGRNTIEEARIGPMVGLLVLGLTSGVSAWLVELFLGTHVEWSIYIYISL